MDGADVEDGFLGLVGHGPHVEGYQHEGTLKLHPIEIWRKKEYKWSGRTYSKLMDVSTKETTSKQQQDEEEVEEEVDTVTVYVGREVSGSLAGALIALHPRRVIFNPGAENPELMQALVAEGIEAEEACTLVLLKAGLY